MQFLWFSHLGLASDYHTRPAEILKVIPFKTWEVAHGWLGELQRVKNGQHLKIHCENLGLINTLMKDDSKS